MRYTTSGPTVPYSQSQRQLTSVLMERGTLVISQSRTPTVDVRIYYANISDDCGTAGAVFKLDI